MSEPRFGWCWYIPVGILLALFFLLRATDLLESAMAKPQNSAATESPAAPSKQTAAKHYRAVWRQATGVDFAGGPVVFNNALYAAGRNGALLAVNIHNGEILWQVATGLKFSVPPLYAEEKIFCGAADGAFAAFAAKDGRRLWTFKAAGSISTSPAVEKICCPAAIYFGAGERWLYALNARSGGLLWRLAVDDRFNGAPAIGRTQLFFGGCDGQLRAVNRVSGKNAAKQECGAYLPSSPVYEAGAVYLANYAGEVRRVAAADAAIIWRTAASETAAPENILTPPALAKEQLYVISDSGALSAFAKASGKKLWRYLAPGGVEVDAGGLIATPTGVLLATSEGEIIELSAAGAVRARYSLGLALAGRPAALGDKLFFNTIDGHIFALTAIATGEE